MTHHKEKQIQILFLLVSQRYGLFLALSNYGEGQLLGEHRAIARVQVLAHMWSENKTMNCLLLEVAGRVKALVFSTITLLQT